MVQVRKNTTNEPREMVMRSEYIIKYLTGQQFYTNYKMGRTIDLNGTRPLSKTQLAALGVRRVFADLVVMHFDHLDIYEFQILPRWSKFGQLLAYLELAKETDTLRYFKDKQIRGIMVNAVDDIFLKNLCEKHNLKYEVYAPSWLDLYFETLRARDYTPIQIHAPGVEIG